MFKPFNVRGFNGFNRMPYDGYIFQLLGVKTDKFNFSVANNLTVNVSFFYHMGNKLTVSPKLVKFLTFSRKSHHPTETLRLVKKDPLLQFYLFFHWIKL